MTVRRRNRPGRVLPGLVAGTLLAGVAVVGVPATAVAQGACDPPMEGRDPIAETPWEEELFALDRLSPRPRADGVTVAVIDSGVDASHPQLDDGQVAAGRDLVEGGTTDGRVDCADHGTAVASIIAASEAGGTAFAGLALGATILPIRVTERDTDPGDDERRRIPPGPVAEAIRLATDEGAQIINLSIAFPEPDEAIEEATRYALDNGVIVVAAAGNRTADVAGETDPPAFPASYDGVVGVGAITPDGLRFTETYKGLSVDLLAPGAAVTAASAGGGHGLWSGTSFATPFVSAAAALVLANSDLTATEVVDRLLATADPGPGSAAESYAGVVSPYRALTGRVAEGEPVAIAPPSEPPPDPAAVARAERWERNTQRAVTVMVIALALTAIGFTAAAVWRRGERHRWQPSQRHEKVFPHPVVDEPERVFYTVPTPRQRR